MSEEKAPRPYQSIAVDSCFEKWMFAGRRGCLVSPTGCIARGTMVSVNRAGKGWSLPIEDVVARFTGDDANICGRPWRRDIPTRIRARLSDGSIGLLKLTGAFRSGTKECFEIRTRGGRMVRASADHRFLTPDGWVRLHELHAGDLVVVEESKRPVAKEKLGPKKKWYELRALPEHPHCGRKGVKPGKGGFTVPVHRLVAEARVNNLELEAFIEQVRACAAGLLFLDPKEWAVHHVDHDTRNNDPSNLVVMSHEEHRKVHEDDARKAIACRSVPDEIVTIESAGFTETFDLSVESPHNFVANGFVVHNSGKTFMAEMVIRRVRGDSKTVTFFAHTQEIILQTAKRLRAVFPRVGVVMASEPLDPDAPIQVATVQTCLARDYFPASDYVILDECHHFAADDWSQLLTHYESAHVLGLTATPQRGDGRPLGDIFAWLVIAAKYSELIADGHIVACKAYQPPEIMVKGIACDPLKAWQRYGENSLTFGFANSVKNAEKFALAFRDAGIPSAAITAETHKGTRKTIIGRFSRGDVRVLWSVNALTEGVDVPEARCGIFAQAFQKAGRYMQAGGRLLRAFPGKEHAIIIDLTGATLIHGLPTEDREYSLDGAGMKRTAEAPLKNCLKCGATILAAYPVCPECDFVFPKSQAQEIKIYSYELREVYAGNATNPDAKRKEFARLLQFSADRSWSVEWCVKQYRQLFQEQPDMSAVTVERRWREWVTLQRVARTRGFKRGFAFARFKALFGESPPKDWKPLTGVEIAMLGDDQSQYWERKQSGHMAREAARHELEAGGK